MIRKFKGLGLALVAIAAMSMAVASLAQAAELHATDPGPVSVFGQQDPADQHIFTTDAGSVKCTQALFEGTVPQTSPGAQQTTEQELTLTATYTGCKAFGINAQIFMNGCKYTITNKLGQHTTSLTAYVDVTGCTTGRVIEVKPTGLDCVITVPQQHSLSHLVFSNNDQAVPHDVTVDITAASIAYEFHGKSCPNMNEKQTELTNNGQYVGKATFQARKDVGTEHAIHPALPVVGGHTYDKLKQTGALVGLLAT